MLVSPMSIALLARLPVCMVSFCGTLLASAGLYISSKATSIWVLYLTYGVMHGMGANVVYMSGLWIIRKNFQKHKDTALGFASAGTFLGPGYVDRIAK